MGGCVVIKWSEVFDSTQKTSLYTHPLSNVSAMPR